LSKNPGPARSGRGHIIVCMADALTMAPVSRLLVSLCIPRADAALSRSHVGRGRWLGLKDGRPCRAGGIRRRRSPSLG